MVGMHLATNATPWQMIALQSFDNAGVGRNEDNVGHTMAPSHDVTVANGCLEMQHKHCISPPENSQKHLPPPQNKAGSIDINAVMHAASIAPVQDCCRWVDLFAKIDKGKKIDNHVPCMECSGTAKQAGVMYEACASSPLKGQHSPHHRTSWWRQHKKNRPWKHANAVLFSASHAPKTKLRYSPWCKSMQHSILR